MSNNETKIRARKMRHEYPPDNECKHKLWSMIYFDAQGNIYQDAICASCGFGWKTLLGYVTKKKYIDVKFTRRTENQKAMEKWIQQNMQHVLRNFFSGMSKNRGYGVWS